MQNDISNAIVKRLDSVTTKNEKLKTETIQWSKNKETWHKCGKSNGNKNKSKHYKRQQSG